MQNLAFQLISEASPSSCERINVFSREVFKTRGGRIGSGMGGVLEALWGYYINKTLSENEKHPQTCELAWMYGHTYNDFACVQCNTDWDPETKQGEILRIEAKSMVASADESKAHFDQLVRNIGEHDILVVLIWDWIPIDERRSSPIILDSFVGGARNIALLRDELHRARGGNFVSANNCPDGCDPQSCIHDGEPLNANGRRERLSGPNSTRVSPSVSYAANFGGMVRMLKTDSQNARDVFRHHMKTNETAWEYNKFIHKNIPSEEYNQFTASEWRDLASLLGMNDMPNSKKLIVDRIRQEYPNYRDRWIEL